MSPVPPEELFSFPCEHLFKAFGPNDEQFVADVRSVFAVSGGLAETDFKRRASSGAAHQCVSVSISLQNFDQLQQIYAALKQVPRLKFLL